MENKCSISLGGTIFLLGVFAKKLNLWPRIHFESILQPKQSLQKSSKVQKKFLHSQGIKSRTPFHKLCVWDKRTKSTCLKEIVFPPFFPLIVLFKIWSLLSPLYKIGMKQIRNKPLETTVTKLFIFVKPSQILQKQSQEHLPSKKKKEHLQCPES